jgi:hypothetical protein
MAVLDKILLWFFLSLSITGIGWSVFSFYKAIKSADHKDDGIRMVLWAFGGLLGLIVAGMSIAYILLPIIFHYSSK